MNLLKEASDSSYVIRKWDIANDQSNSNYDVGNGILYITEILKSNLCNYNDIYMFLLGDITINLWLK